MHGDADLHYGFVVSLLNDLFGIQVRGGCSCAGPYGHSLLNMDMDYSRAIEAEIQVGAMVLRPGWVRLNFNYFIDESEFQYLLDAIALVAAHGWRLLPYYHFDEATGVWRYQSQAMDLPASIPSFDFLAPLPEPLKPTQHTMDLDAVRSLAEQELLRTDRKLKSSDMHLSESGERLRWFVLPQEALLELTQYAESA